MDRKYFGAVNRYRQNLIYMRWRMALVGRPERLLCAMFYVYRGTPASGIVIEN
jgi:hypothetical protein